MLPILDLASQLNKNSHFNHFQSVLGYEYVQGWGWKEATGLEPSAEKGSVCTAWGTCTSYHFREFTLNRHVQAADPQSKGKPEKAVAMWLWKENLTNFSLFFFITTQNVLLFGGVGAQPAISHVSRLHYENGM